MLVKCLTNNSIGYDGIVMHHQLTPGRLYEVVALDMEMIRLVSDDGWPVLYENEIVQLVDDTLPADWVLILGNQCEVYIGPNEFRHPGFWESLFDGEPEVIEVYLKRQDEFFGRNNPTDNDPLRYRRFFEERKMRRPSGAGF